MQMTQCTCDRREECGRPLGYLIFGEKGQASAQQSACYLVKRHYSWFRWDYFCVRLSPPYSYVENPKSAHPQRAQARYVLLALHQGGLIAHVLWYLLPWLPRLWEFDVYVCVSPDLPLNRRRLKGTHGTVADWATFVPRLIADSGVK